jgi:hypothetical protein
MEEFRGLTAEMYQAIVAIVDDRLRDARVTRDGFAQLTVLKREFGWEVGVLERTWQQWNNDLDESSIFGQATDPVHPEVRARLREPGIPLLFSYGRFAW